jgi:adenine phosphoribosyltransferase
MTELRALIRTVADYPKPGVLFRDLTPLMGDAAALRATVHSLVAPFRSAGVELVAGMEARGFIFGALAAWELGAGFVPLRKPGKLPAAIEAVSYALEYGTASLEVHRDALGGANRVLLVDDVLATGGTAAASVDLVERLGASVVGLAFVLELAALGGRRRLVGRMLHSVITL